MGFKNHMNAILCAIFGLISTIVGIILLSTYVSYEGYEIVKDYTDCNVFNSERKCKDTVKDYKTTKDCVCYLTLEVKEKMEKPVTVFYELDAYDQITSKYSQSRDDNQLAGHLSPKPAASCGSSYAYTNTSTGLKPIAPCGELADAMFTDVFSVHINNEYLNINHTGLISEDDKKNFHNPPGILSEAFKDFAKPINWKQNVWELDTANPKNNGFENEAFIIWMNTDLKRKPAWSVYHTAQYEHGVPPGNYTLRVKFFYPTSRYDGRRLFIISNKQVHVNSVSLGFGITLLVIGLLFIILAAFIRFRQHPQVAKIIERMPRRN